MAVRASSAPVVYGRSMTIDDWASLGDKFSEYELVEGRLVPVSEAGMEHNHVVSRLFVLLGSWILQHDWGEIYGHQTGFAIDQQSGFLPDLVCVSTAKLAGITRRWIEGSADLIIEVLSESTRRHDRVTKFQAYAQRGVEHYWIVDLESQTVEQYHLVGTLYELTATMSGQDSLCSELFPGLEIPLREVFPPAGMFGDVESSIATR